MSESEAMADEMLANIGAMVLGWRLYGFRYVVVKDGWPEPVMVPSDGALSVWDENDVVKIGQALLDYVQKDGLARLHKGTA